MATETASLVYSRFKHIAFPKPIDWEYLNSMGIDAKEDVARLCTNIVIMRLLEKLEAEEEYKKLTAKAIIYAKENNLDLKDTKVLYPLKHQVRRTKDNDLPLNKNHVQIKKD
jgi:hypothetical protein